MDSRKVPESDIREAQLFSRFSAQDHTHGEHEADDPKDAPCSIVMVRCGRMRGSRVCETGTLGADRQVAVATSAGDGSETRWIPTNHYRSLTAEPVCDC